MISFFYRRASLINFQNFPQGLIQDNGKVPIKLLLSLPGAHGRIRVTVSDTRRTLSGPLTYGRGVLIHRSPN